MAASSYHPGGVNVAFVDGSVHFISETIDAGDPAKGETDLPFGSFPALVDPNRPQDYKGPSLRGIWGALGSCKSGEVVTAP
jgi:prepilin-type processing-associated H-X9-DG protein